jgi:hypothetical protein
VITSLLHRSEERLQTSTERRAKRKVRRYKSDEDFRIFCISAESSKRSPDLASEALNVLVTGRQAVEDITGLGHGRFNVFPVMA